MRASWRRLRRQNIAAVQGHPIATILGESRHSGTLQREASRSEDAAKQAVADLTLNIEERKELSVASEARESVLGKRAIDLSMGVSLLKQAASTAEPRCEAKLRGLREELEGQHETLKSVLVGMAKQLGLEDRVAGNGPPMHTHHAPRPPAPPRVTPPTEAVTEENVQDWIDFWKEAPQHAASGGAIGRFLVNVAPMADKIHKGTCFYCAGAVRSQTTPSGSKFYVHTNTQSNCKTSKCTARDIVCRKCETAGHGFVH